jgi:hypothetical protein
LHELGKAKDVGSFAAGTRKPQLCFKKLSSRLFETSEAGSRVLMSNPYKVWLAQLVTRDRVLVCSNYEEYTTAKLSQVRVTGMR